MEWISLKKGKQTECVESKYTCSPSSFAHTFAYLKKHIHFLVVKQTKTRISSRFFVYQCNKS